MKTSKSGDNSTLFQCSMDLDARLLNYYTIICNDFNWMIKKKSLCQ